LALTLSAFFRQNVPTMRLTTLERTGSRAFETLSGAAIGFDFGHFHSPF
jgi:hypothetical protein